MVMYEGLIEITVNWARAYLRRYPDKEDRVIKSSLNWVRGYYKALTGEDIPPELLETIEKRLREEFG
ncbi:hypothetical protein [Thermococcus sp. 21S7]|uniref:hypothetical protein n=1 Tax=Thermococcus sp. 21S7 TaxID=1638221 RepID=UPI00143C8BD1|nr:hypothetical protein [Thermococcus sp. 21S7]NJE61810.1 hypothetical protein [Thermococcus sp. 21S7]